MTFVIWVLLLVSFISSVLSMPFPDQYLYQLQTSSNITCPNGCITCTTENSCDVCQENTEYVDYQNACLSCLSYGCSVCQALTNCTECNYPLVNINGTCISSQLINATCAYCNQSVSNFSVKYCYCQVCMDGYYSNNQGLCFNCISYCQSCVSQSNCLECYPGFALSINGTECVACPNDYCPDICPPTKYYNFTSKTCTSCLPNCLTCENESNCSFCFEGYYLTSQQLCNPCYPGCTNCINITECFECGGSTYLYQKNNISVCIQCPLLCLTCELQNQTVVCVECSIGTYLKYSAPNMNPICASCEDGCQICSNSTCYLSYEGYYLNNGTCIACNPAIDGSIGCSNCTESSCIVCSSGYQFVNGECLVCQIGCAQCQNQTTCISCKQGFYAFQNTCLSCLSSLPDCGLCSNSSVCLQCLDQFFLNNVGQCQLCPQGCTACQNSTICKSCGVNYYLNNYNCILCSSICSKCMSANLCLGCNQGYFYTQANLSCTNCLPNCQTCSSSTSCSICFDDLQFLNGACVCKNSSYVVKKKIFPWWGYGLILIIVVTIIVVIIFSLHRCYKKGKQRQKYDLMIKNSISGGVQISQINSAFI